MKDTILPNHRRHTSRAPSLLRRFAFLLPLFAAPGAAMAAQPAACPAHPVRVVRSAGGVNDNLGAVPGIPDLCRVKRADGEGHFFFGGWRADWPGAGLAYEALAITVRGVKGTRASFVTHSVPGMQWTDTFTNEGVEPMVVDGHTYRVLKLAHEREGLEGNTYHSIITVWRDVATGVALKTVENQIAGQSYGPNTTWQALRVERLP